jgi:hypothetical protein
MKLLPSILLTSACIAGTAFARHHSGTPAILPTPQHMVVKDRGFTITPSTVIYIGDRSRQALFAAQQINDALLETGHLTLPVSELKETRPPQSDYIVLGDPVSQEGQSLLAGHHGVLKPEMRNEGYFLDSDTDGVVILAESAAGRFYGVMSLVQMIHPGTSGVAVDGATIYDCPRFALRGISDDISRGQVSTVRNFKKIIRSLARYKMNAYFLYIEDMFAFKNYPRIGAGRGALTAEEVKELDSYAKDYFVHLAPIFQTLGHWENILTIPEYVSLAEYPGGRTLNVADERVYTMLDKMIGELSSCFSSPWFNFGADETRDVGLGANKKRVDSLGLPAVLAEHYRRVAALVRRHGKRPMMYADIILKNPEILKLIPRDIVMVDWNYDPQFQYDSPRVFRDAGFPFMVSPAVRNYAGPFPDFFTSFGNIRQFIAAGVEDSAVGVLTSSWNDYGGEELRELNYYGYACAAEYSWQPERADFSSFSDRFFRDFCGTEDIDDLKAAYAILSSPSNRYSWYELWRHPMLPFLPPGPQKGHSPAIFDRIASITTTMPVVLSLLNQAAGGSPRERDQCDYLAFVARLNLWFAMKVESQEEVRHLCLSVGNGADRDSVARRVMTLCNAVVDSLLPLRGEFQRLWLRTNKPEGLENLLRRYDRQRSYWKEKIEQVRRGDFWVDPEIESKWIATQASHAWFRKTFQAPADVSSAALQVIGDTHVKLWFNGSFLGELYARRSNSLSTEYQRIRVFDIFPLLRKTTNVIAAEAENFTPGEPGGINIYGELRGRNSGLLKITSDTTWKVTTAPPAAWTGDSVDNTGWRHAGVKAYPYTVVRPDFESGRSSWIEQ